MIRTYDPKDIKITVAGITILGYPDGVFVNVERASEAYLLSEGVDNFNTRIKTNKKSGSFKVTLQQSSPSNNYLSTLAIADENTGDGIVPVTLIDFKGDTKVISPQTFIMKLPVIEFSNEISTREWEFISPSLEIYVGGNFTG